MQKARRWYWMALGIMLGAAAAAYFTAEPRPAWAYNDRHEDYIMATGTILTGPGLTSDCVWLLDYRAGKLLGTIIERNSGQVQSWADVDLMTQFNLSPKQNVHVLMTTGQPLGGQSTLYITEITSGRFGVYSIGPKRDGRPGLDIFRHDLSSFRQAAVNP
jgi:hypothetical protein